MKKKARSKGMATASSGSSQGSLIPSGSASGSLSSQAANSGGQGWQSSESLITLFNSNFSSRYFYTKDLSELCDEDGLLDRVNRLADDAAKRGTGLPFLHRLHARFHLHLAGLTFARLSDRSQRLPTPQLLHSMQRVRQLMQKATESAEAAAAACDAAKGPRPRLATATLLLTALLQDLYLELDVLRPSDSLQRLIRFSAPEPLLDFCARLALAQAFAQAALDRPEDPPAWDPLITLTRGDLTSLDPCTAALLDNHLEDLAGPYGAVLHRGLIATVRHRTLTDLLALSKDVLACLHPLAKEPEALRPGPASAPHWSRCLQLLKQPTHGQGVLAAWQVHVLGMGVYAPGKLDAALEKNILQFLPVTGRGRPPTSITEALAEPLPIFQADLLSHREKWAASSRATAKDTSLQTVRGAVTVQPPADDQAKKVAADRTKFRAAAATWNSLDAAEREEICTVSLAELTDAVKEEGRRQGCLAQAVHALESLTAANGAAPSSSDKGGKKANGASSSSSAASSSTVTPLVDPYACSWCGFECQSSQEIVDHVHAAHALPLCVIEADGPVTPCVTRASYGPQPLQRLKPSVLARPAFCWLCKDHIFGACYTGDRRRANFVRGDDGQIHPSIMCCKCYRDNPKAHKFITERFDPSDRPHLHALLQKAAADPPPYGRSKLTPLPPNASSAVHDEHEVHRFLQHALGSWAYDRGSAKQMASNRLRPEEAEVIDPSLEDLTAGCSTANDMVHLLKQQAKHLEGTPLRDAQLGLMRSCVDVLMDLIVGTLVRCPSAPVPLSKSLMKQMIDHIREVRASLEEALAKAQGLRSEGAGGELERIVEHFVLWSDEAIASAEQMMNHASSDFTSFSPPIPYEGPAERLLRKALLASPRLNDARAASRLGLLALAPTGKASVKPSEWLLSGLQRQFGEDPEGLLRWLAGDIEFEPAVLLRLQAAGIPAESYENGGGSFSFEGRRELSTAGSRVLLFERLEAAAEVRKKEVLQLIGRDTPDVSDLVGFESDPAKPLRIAQALDAWYETMHLNLRSSAVMLGHVLRSAASNAGANANRSRQETAAADALNTGYRNSLLQVALTELVLDLKIDGIKKLKEMAIRGIRGEEMAATIAAVRNLIEELPQFKTKNNIHLLFSECRDIRFQTDLVDMAIKCTERMAQAVTNCRGRGVRVLLQCYSSIVLSRLQARAEAVSRRNEEALFAELSGGAADAKKQGSKKKGKNGVGASASKEIVLPTSASVPLLNPSSESSDQEEEERRGTTEEEEEDDDEDEDEMLLRMAAGRTGKKVANAPKGGASGAPSKAETSQQFVNRMVEAFFGGSESEGENGSAAQSPWGSEAAATASTFASSLITPTKGPGKERGPVPAKAQGKDRDAGAKANAKGGGKNANQKPPPSGVLVTPGDLSRAAAAAAAALASVSLSRSAASAASPRASGTNGTQQPNGWGSAGGGAPAGPRPQRTSSTNPDGLAPSPSSASAGGQQPKPERSASFNNIGLPPMAPPTLTAPPIAAHVQRFSQSSTPAPQAPAPSLPQSLPATPSGPPLAKQPSLTFPQGPKLPPAPQPPPQPTSSELHLLAQMHLMEQQLAHAAMMQRQQEFQATAELLSQQLAAQGITDPSLLQHHLHALAVQYGLVQPQPMMAPPPQAAPPPNLFDPTAQVPLQMQAPLNAPAPPQLVDKWGPLSAMLAAAASNGDGAGAAAALKVPGVSSASSAFGGAFDHEPFGHSTSPSSSSLLGAGLWSALGESPAASRPTTTTSAIPTSSSSNLPTSLATAFSAAATSSAPEDRGAAVLIQLLYAIPSFRSNLLASDFQGSSPDGAFAGFLRLTFETLDLQSRSAKQGIIPAHQALAVPSNLALNLAQRLEACGCLSSSAPVDEDTLGRLLESLHRANGPLAARCFGINVLHEASCPGCKRTSSTASFTLFERAFAQASLELGLIESVRGDKLTTKTPCDRTAGGCGRTILLRQKPQAPPLPQVLVVTVGWEGVRATPDDITALFRGIPISTKMSDIFGAGIQPEGNLPYDLRCILCTGPGGKVVAYSRSASSIGSWDRLEGSSGSAEVGEFTSVRSECIRDQLQPVAVVFTVSSISFPL